MKGTRRKYDVSGFLIQSLLGKYISLLNSRNVCILIDVDGPLLNHVFEHVRSLLGVSTTHSEP